jgi:Beta-lactamase class C and other penicillin binding proteins
MSPLADSLDTLARDSDFSGAISVRNGTDLAFEQAYGLANRADDVPNTPDTRFGIASGTKGFTALTVMRLVETGRLRLSTRARSLLGTDLPLIDDAVTIEHLLAHRSGIGDYLDEDLIEELEVWPFAVSAHALDATGDYLAVLDGHPQKFPAGTQFSYSNGGYVVLAILCERASGVAFHDLVRATVTEPAAMARTAFLRMTSLPEDAAIGYLDDGRTNVANIPERGNGDGGIFSTVADFTRFWRAFFAGTIVSMDSAAAMVAPRSDVPSERKRYGLGFWLHKSNDAVTLEGLDAGVSFRSTHDPRRTLTATVISNTAVGAWPIVRYLEEVLAI